MLPQGQHSNTEIDRDGSNVDFVVLLLAQLREHADHLDSLVEWANRADERGLPVEPTRRRRPHRQRRLSPAEVDELTDAYRDGSTLVELASRFQINRTTVIDHLTRRSVPRRRQPSMTPTQVHDAAELYGTGLSLAAVAERVGFDKKTVRKELAKAGVVIRSSNRSRTGGTRGT